MKGEAIKMLPGLLKANPEILRSIITSMAADLEAKEAPKAKTQVKEEEKEEEIPEISTSKTSTKK